MEMNGTIAQIYKQLRQNDTDVHMQDGQEKRSALNLVFSQVQGSREVKKPCV